jgi:phenylpropionate dioxygenase-like ring-hydroxylating dioxygenase large terminal subunit
MLKNFWYAVEFSSAIKGNPKRLTVMGEPLVLYSKAGDNKVVAVIPS